jgi:hypothetical protein
VVIERARVCVLATVRVWGVLMGRGLRVHSLTKDYMGSAHCVT